MDVSKKMAHLYPVVGHKVDPHKWIGAAMKNIKKGALTKTAKAAHMKPLEFAKEVVEHPEAHSALTRKRAHFLLNIQRK